MPSTPGWRTCCYGFLFLTRLTILPWGNCKNYSISCSWWILVYPSPTFAWRPCRCHLEACLWYSDFQQEHLKPNAKCFLLNYPNTVVWVTSWNSLPSPRGFSTLYPIVDIMLCLSLGRIYPWNMCLNTFFLSIVLFNLMITFFFALVCLTFLVIYMI